MPVTDVPRPVPPPPPLHTRSATRSLMYPGVILSMGHLLLLPASIIHIPAHPHCQPWPRPSPLPVSSGGVMFFFLPVPYASASPSLCSMSSLGVFWSLIPFRCPFAQRREAWAPPIPGNCSPSPPPLHYSDMPLPLRLLASPRPGPCHYPLFLVIPPPLV